MFHLTVFNMNDKKWTTNSSHSTLEEAQKSFVSLAQDLDANCEIPSEINNFSSLVLEDKIIQLVYSEREADKTDYSKIVLRGIHNGAYVWPVHLDEEETQEEETQAAQETETETETPASQGAPKAKRLKASTLKSYNAKALAKHLDKLPSSSYRIDFAYGSIYKEQSDHYLFYCSINHFDRDEITSAIHSVYAEIGI